MRDERLLLAGSSHATAGLWDCAGGNQLLTFRGHQGEIVRVGFSPDPDQRHVLTGSLDGTLRLWDRRRSNELLTLRGRGRGMRHACFTPDGKQVLGASDDGSIRRWWLGAENLRRAADMLEVGDFTAEERARLPGLLGER